MSFIYRPVCTLDDSGERLVGGGGLCLWLLGVNPAQNRRKALKSHVQLQFLRKYHHRAEDQPMAHVWPLITRLTYVPDFGKAPRGMLHGGACLSGGYVARLLMNGLLFDSQMGQEPGEHSTYRGSAFCSSSVCSCCDQDWAWKPVAFSRDQWLCQMWPCLHTLGSSP